MIDEFNETHTRWARFSDDRTMRYRLAVSVDGITPLRVGDDGSVHLDTVPGDVRSESTTAFVMLNPSVADAFQNDPTVRRGISFARALGSSIYEAANIDAYRATDPKELYKLACGFRGDDPVNDAQILAACGNARWAIAAWGRHGALDGRGLLVHRKLVSAGVKLHHLGLTKGGGHPKHPLYIKGGTVPQELARPEGSDTRDPAMHHPQHGVTNE